MNSVDIVLGLVLLLAFIWGFKKGLFVTLTSLIGLVAGVYCAVYFSHFVGGYLARWFSWSENTTKWAAFALTFLIIVFVLNLIGKFLTKIADFTALGLMNKLLGGVFSTLQYAFILSVVFLFFNGSNFTGFVISEEKKEGSMLYGHLSSLAPMLLPEIIEKFHEMKQDQPSEEESQQEL